LAEVRSPSFDSGALFDPQGVAAGPAATWFVADRGHHRVAVVDATGIVARDFGRRGHDAGDLLNPTDVAVDAARDRVYVADSGNRRVAVFNLAGDWVGEWLTAGPNGALVPRSLAVSTAGEVYVLSPSTARVERFGPDGVWRGGWGGEGDEAGSFATPEDLAVHPDGRVIVADTGNRRLQVFNAVGAPLAERASLGVRDVAVDSASGRILTLHNGPGGDRDVITIYESTLVELQQIRSEDLAPGARFRPANHLATGAAGRVAVTTSFGGENGRHGLRQYASDWSLAAATVADPLAFAGFLDPVAIDAAPDGTLSVLEGNLRATRRYRPDGSFDGQLLSAWGDELALGTDGSLYTADLRFDVEVRRHRRDVDATAWQARCDCFSGAGIAADDRRVYVTAAISRTILAFDPSQADPDPRPLLSLTIADAPYAWPLDVDLGPDGRLYAAGGEGGGIVAFDPVAARQVTAWQPAGAGAERVSVASDGTIFTLGLDGKVSAWSPTGAEVGSFQPEPVPGYGVVVPGDIAAADGRVYVLDEVSRAILVYVPDGNGGAPTPTPVPDPPCTVSGDKTAAPSTIQLGQEATIELSLDIRCRPDRELSSDVVLVIDRSNSMANVKLAAARSAADTFVRSPELDLGRNRVALVSFSDIVSLDQSLTDDLAAIRNAIANVQHAGNTDLAAAMRRAQLHIAGEGKDGALPVILMLTDGRPNREGQPYVDAVVESGRARARGALVYTIGLGDNVIAELMTAMAGSPARFFDAPRPEQLDPIYDALSQAVGGVVATDVIIEDTLSSEVTLVPASASPAAEVVGDLLRWQLGALPEGGARVSLRVTPNRLGRLPTNALAVARYVADGVPYQFEFPIPEIEVVDAPTPTATPTVTHTPSPSPTPTASPTSSGPATVYLPLTMRNACKQEDARLGADIVLVLDTSSSMAGPKLAAAQAAATQFLDLVDPRRDTVALVQFDGAARRAAALTSNLALLRQRIAMLAIGSGSRIDLGLEKAIEELGYRARKGSQRVIVLLSDGLPPASARSRTVAMAELARSQDISIFAIGLGATADDDFLRRVVTGDGAYYDATSPGDLADIYRLVAANLPCR
jgi:Mg-chelatase subunit ChlD/sugar lactone lactonase YvrE